jgi:hypothetical protein
MEIARLRERINELEGTINRVDKLSEQNASGFEEIPSVLFDITDLDEWINDKLEEAIANHYVDKHVITEEEGDASD